MVLIFQETLQIGLNVMTVQPASSRHILCDMSDGVAVLEHIFPDLQITECHLMAHGNVVESKKTLPCCLDFCIFCDIAKSNCHIIARMDV